jgi:MFS family permease
MLQPIYGAISDRIGRKPLLIFFGVAGTLATVPILTTLQGTKSPWIAFLLICGAWIFVAGYTSINAVVKAELFPTSIRATGVAVPYALTVSIFGGTAPAIALFFKQQGHEQWFYYYLAGVIFLSLLVYTPRCATPSTTRRCTGTIEVFSSAASSWSGLSRPSTTSVIEERVQDVDARHRGEHDGAGVRTLRPPRQPAASAPSRGRSAAEALPAPGRAPTRSGRGAAA